MYAHQTTGCLLLLTRSFKYLLANKISLISNVHTLAYRALHPQLLSKQAGGINCRTVCSNTEKCFAL